MSKVDLIYQVGYVVTIERAPLERAAQVLEGWRRDFFRQAVTTAIEQSSTLAWLRQPLAFRQVEKGAATALLKNEVKMRVDYALQKIEVPQKEREALSRAIGTAAIKITPIHTFFSYN